MFCLPCDYGEEARDCPPGRAAIYIEELKSWTSRCRCRKYQNYNVRTSLKRIEQKENKAREAYMAGIDTLDEYRKIRNALRAEREALDVKPETISREEARRILLGRIRELTQMLKSGDFTNEQKGIAVRSVFDKIIFDRPQDTLHYFYLYS